MIRNYLLLALRNLLRRRFFAFINLAGLTVGLACIALVILYAHYERGYDRFHERSEDIYRLEHHFRSSWYSTLGYNDYFQATESDQLAYPLHLESIPQIEVAAQVVQFENLFVETRNRQFVAKNLLYTLTGTALLDIFSFEWVDGSPERALSQPYTAVITEETAQQYFGQANPIGERLTIDSLDYLITGLIKELPPNSHLHPEIILQVSRMPHWGAHTYVRVQPNTDMAALTEQVIPPNERYEASGLFKGVRFTPLEALHFAEPTKYDFEPPGDSRYLFAFLAIGILILLITTTNYMNLAIAMYSHRNREIGIRKVAGARRSQVALQFLMESLLLAFLSLPLALGLVELVIPRFNAFMQVQVYSRQLFLAGPLMALLGTVLLTALIAGSYPAWFLSGRKAIELFRPQNRTGREGLNMRRVMVMIQFVLLISLGSATWLVNGQLRFMQKKDLGYDPAGVLVLSDMDGARAYRKFRELLQNTPGIEAIAAGAPPGSSSNKLTFKGEDSETIYDNAIDRWVDYDYFTVLGIPCPPLEAKRQAGQPLPDTLYLINQTAALQLGYGEEAIGKKVFEEPEEAGEEFARTIEGILPDFHYYSLHEAIEPQFYHAYREPGWVYQALVRINPQANIPEVLGKIEEAYLQVLPDHPFVYHFLEEDLLERYRQEERIASLGMILSGIAILLALIGLMGLTTFLTQLRRKEIGVRRVLGASILQVLQLLNRDFTWLVGVGLLFAAPLTWLAIGDWLSSFAYQIDISPWVFVGGGLIAFLIAILTVSFQGIRALHKNPADILRDE